MADKNKKLEPKLTLEREYTIPLRSGWLKVAKHKRANKAVKTLKEFIVRHMKIYDRDLRKIKVDNYLNNEIRFRGMRKPPAKVKVKAKKYDDGIVRVELVTLPKHIEFIKSKKDKVDTEIKKKIESAEKVEEVKTEDKEVKEEEKEKAEDSKNKEEASKEENLKLAKEQAKEMKHAINPKESRTQNIGGKRASRGH